MKKAELEKEILELKAKIAALESRQPCYHYCYCNHNIPCNLPHYPSTPYWTTITSGGISSTGGTVTFGNIS